MLELSNREVNWWTCPNFDFIRLKVISYQHQFIRSDENAKNKNSIFLERSLFIMLTYPHQEKGQVKHGKHQYWFKIPRKSFWKWESRGSMLSQFVFIWLICGSVLLERRRNIYWLMVHSASLKIDAVYDYHIIIVFVIWINHVWHFTRNTPAIN